MTLPSGTRLAGVHWRDHAVRALSLGNTVFILHHGHAIDAEATFLVGPPNNVVAIVRGTEIRMVPSIYHYQEHS